MKTKKTAGTSVELFLSQFCGDADIVTPVSSEDETPGHRPRNFRGVFNPIPEAFEYVMPHRRSILRDSTGAGGSDASLGVIFYNAATNPADAATNAAAEATRDEWRRVTGGGFLQPFGQALKGKRFYNHVPAFRAAARVGASVWDDLFTFTIERNPWDKALSLFYWKARRRKNYTFAAFIDEGDVGINYPRYCHPRTGAVLVDRIIYYHQLNAALGEICDALDIPWDGILPVRAKGATRTDRQPYQELFTGELARYREALDRLFSAEIELHGWDFNTGMPTRDLSRSRVAKDS